MKPLLFGLPNQYIIFVLLGPGSMNDKIEKTEKKIVTTC